MIGFFSVVLLSILVFFRRIDSFPLRNWDESWYAEIVKNMASGNWGFFMPFWNGRYYFDHAQLYFWLSTPIVKIWGNGEWQSRFVSALAAVMATTFIYLIGKKLVGVRLGIISSIVLLTMGGVVIRFAHGNLDSLLTCLFLASIYFYLLSFERRIWSIACGVSLSLGLLVKSWGIGLLPYFFIILFSYLLNKKPPKNLGFITLIPLVIFFVWLAIGLSKFGNQFVSWYLLNPSENRLVDPIGNFSFDYFKFTLNDLGAWILLFLLLPAFRKLRPKPEIRCFLIASIILSTVYIFFLNFLSDKSGWYLIVVYPLLAICVAWFIDNLISKSRIFIFPFFILLAISYLNVLRVENIYPDRSAVGAQLGVEASKLIPIQDEIIFDDHDFTSFLYYSNQNHIFTIQDTRKEGEWWILVPSEIDGFILNNPKTWIITREPSKFDGLLRVANLNGYSFLKTY